MTQRINTKLSFCFFISLFLFFEITNAQTVVRQMRKGKKHYLYINEDYKVGCTQDLNVIEAARLIRQNRSTPITSSSRKKQQIVQEASQSASTANITVTYDAGFNSNLDAKAAFQKAVDIWSALITTPITIRINAVFEPLDPDVLGSTNTGEDLYPFVGSPVSVYPTALIKFFENDEVYATTEFDMDISFNSALTDLDFGLTGAPAPMKYDFVSIVLHEIGHGLGFGGTGRADDTNLPCDGTTKGCFGYTVDGIIYPGIYDRYVENLSNTSILTFTNPSLALRTLITSNNLYFDSPLIRDVNGGNRARLYAPSSEESGSTYSHFDENTYDNTANALMTPYFDIQEVRQSMGPLGCALMKTIGWTMSGACAAALPVELSNFQAVNKGNRNILTWTTLTETNNKMVKIERSNDGRNFTVIGEVKGAGSTNFPRSYTFYDEGPLSISYYRLRQIDFDGKTKPSNIVSVSLNKNSEITLFPNPTKDKIAFNTTAFEPNRVVVYNNLGQIVMDKIYQINELDVSSLPTGLYVLELTSDNLKVNKRFVKN
jgi:hypothetical protein